MVTGMLYSWFVGEFVGYLGLNAQQGPPASHFSIIRRWARSVQRV